MTFLETFVVYGVCFSGNLQGKLYLDANMLS